MGYIHWTNLDSNICGIYKITNNINKKMYIGQSCDIRTRWWQHVYKLNNNKHDNSHLQGAWNKYGQKNFSFEIIEKCDINNLDNREVFWISKYNTTNPDIGYNYLLGGVQNNRGRKLTDEQKKYMSEVKNPDKIVQLDFEGNIINIWRSATHAQRTLGNVRAQSILECCKHKCYQAKGYIWFYLDEFLNIEFNIEKYLYEHHRYFDIPIEQYDLYGKLIKVWSQNELKNNSEYKLKVIKSCCNHNKQKCTHLGYIWKYKYDYEFKLTDKYLEHCRKTSGLYYIDQFDLNMNYIKTWSSGDLLNNSEFDIYSINRVCKKIQNNHRGYIWKEHIV